MSRVPVEPSSQEFIADLEARLSESAFKIDLFDSIRTFYSVGSTLSEGFGRMMAHLLHDHGLILLDPSDPELKGLMAPIFEEEIRHPRQSTRLLNEAAEQLSEMGYEPQIEKTEDSTSLFFFDEQGFRRKLFFRDGWYRVEDTEQRMRTEELLAIVERTPERLDPNVTLRPVIQDALLPTVAYVAGPGEIAYFAQLRAVYDLFGVQMPLLFPRARCILVERKIQRIMDRYRLTVDDLSIGPDELFGRLVKDRFPENLERLFRDSTEDIEAALGRLGGPLTSFDPTLSGLMDSTKGRVVHQVSILRNKALQAQRRASETLRGQIERVCAHIHPLGRPQERTLNIVPYLVSYGPDLIPELMDALDLDRWTPQIIQP
jgi:bacillithiol biosynthesis cysteine-adding enzyme BshC